MNFEEEVLMSSTPVLVDFWAPWCGPCKMLGPVISAIAEKYDGKLKVCKYNCDDSTEFAEKYSVDSIPAVKFFGLRSAARTRGNHRRHHLIS